MNIAIVGLGRIGTEFFSEIVSLKDKGIHIVAVAELADTPGKKIASELGINIKNSNAIATMGETLDIIFDLSGNSEVRKELRSILQKENNYHTTIFPETFINLLWSVMTDKLLPDVHEHKGY